MNNLNITTNPELEIVFKNYPSNVKDQMNYLRKLVLETASDIDEIKELEETLKWGESSFLTKIGSTLRMDWKPKNPNHYAMYFKCTSRLVETFKLVYATTFNFEGNRAIVFKLDDKIPTAELKSCIQAALTYHKVKQLPTLGISCMPE